MKIVQLENVTYEGSGKVILDGVTLDVNKGDCISIIGESGSGKSTLLKICSDLIDIKDGSIKYKEKDYSSYEPTDLRKEISYSIQTPYLFGNTVYDNLEFPFKIRNKEVDVDRITYLLNKFNLNKDILNENVNSLSGGQKQRVSFIRNIIFKPEVLLLDEVTSSLDKDNTILIENYIEELNKQGVTILWVTHSKEQSKTIFNKRITISKGKVERVEEFN